MTEEKKMENKGKSPKRKWFSIPIYEMGFIFAFVILCVHLAGRYFYMHVSQMRFELPSICKYAYGYSRLFLGIPIAVALILGTCFMERRLKDKNKAMLIRWFVLLAFTAFNIWLAYHLFFPQYHLDDQLSKP